jgi:arabinose-5-phosphate isomerase
LTKTDYKRETIDLRDFLRAEADAIYRTVQRLSDTDIARSLELLTSCTGKIIVTGVGKSGLIAQKIAATITSIGAAAVYLHPSDALHGGLGVVAERDLLIAISYSGETDEILALLPSVRRKGGAVIAITGKIQSSLARSSDAVLDASVENEACPLNLVPTSSTTVALAIGDSLALALMHIRGVTPEDFAANHPAGRLGKRLTLRVEDLMHSAERNPVTSEKAGWLEVIRSISRGGLGAVNVVGDGGELLGIITDGDLRRAIENKDPSSLHNLKAGSIMTRNPVVAHHSLLAYEALQLMEERPSQISVLPVVDEENRCIGLIRVHDIVRTGL